MRNYSHNHVQILLDYSQTKTAIRTLRSDALQSLKKMGKNEDVHRLEKQIQKVIDDATKKVTDAVVAKEKEIMTAS